MDQKGYWNLPKKHSAKILDLRFTDLPGLWQHVSYPIGELEESSFKEGFGFDASSIRGWQSIHESDMLLIPDPNTAFMDPFRAAPTLVMIGDAADPPSHEALPARSAPHRQERRGLSEIHRRRRHRPSSAPKRSSSSSTASASISAPQHGFYYIDSDEGRWNYGPRMRATTQPRLSPALQGRLLPRPARWTTTRTCAPRWS